MAPVDTRRPYKRAAISDQQKRRELALLRQVQQRRDAQQHARTLASSVISLQNQDPEPVTERQSEPEPEPEPEHEPVSEPLSRDLDVVQASKQLRGSAARRWFARQLMLPEWMIDIPPRLDRDCEADEIYKICGVIGSPNQNTWAEGLQLANAFKYQFPQFASVHLSLLIPSASGDAINLISSLCSWDPGRRPTAAEALQHPFFQPCFYIPPSLRMRAAAPRTPPPAGMTGTLEQKSTRRYPSTLSNAKPASNFSSAKIHASLSSGVQRKLEMDYQEETKNQKSAQSSTTQQPRYRPPARNHPGSVYSSRSTYGVADAAEKLAQMTVSSGRQPVRPPPPTQMKAGGWHGHSEFLVRSTSHEIPAAARSYSRRVVG